MKKNLLKLLMVAFMLISNFVMFAQVEDPGAPGHGTGPEDGGDSLGTPIDSKLIYLAIVGVVFSVYYFSKLKQQKAQA